VLSEKFEDVPESIRTAFEGHPYLSAPKVAALLEMDIKTLRKHTDADDIRCRYKGIGVRRPHRVYTLADVAEFLRIMRMKRNPCVTGSDQHPSVTPSRHIGNTSFTSIPAATRGRRGRPIKLARSA